MLSFSTYILLPITLDSRLVRLCLSPLHLAPLPLHPGTSPRAYVSTEMWQRQTGGRQVRVRCGKRKRSPKRLASIKFIENAHEGEKGGK